MAENTNPQAGNSTPPATPPAGNPPATPAPAAVTPPNQPDNSIEAIQAKLDAATGKLTESVTAEKNLRTRLKEAEAAEAKWKEYELSQKTEAEKLQQQLADAQAANAKAIADANTLRAKVVAQANGCDPDAAALWLGTQTLTEYTDEALKAALATAPAWVKAQQQGITTAPANPSRQAGELSHEQINQMTPQQYADYLEKKSRTA